MSFWNKTLEALKKLLYFLGDLFKKFIDLVKKNNIAKIGVAVGLAGIIALTVCLSFCGNCKGGGNTPPNDPLAGYQVVETLNGKTAKQIYAETIELTNQENFSHHTKYSIVCTTSLPQMGTSSSRLWHEVTVKKAGNNIYRQLANTDQSGTFLEQEGRFVNENVFVDGVNYFFKARILNTATQQETNVKARTKTEMTYDNLLESMGVTESELNNPFYTFKDESFDGVKIYVNKEDAEDAFFTLTLSGEKAKMFSKNLLCASIEREVTPDASNEITFKVLLTKDGAIEKVDVSFRTQISDQMITFLFNYKGEITIFDIGSTTVSIPENANLYE